MIEGRSIGQKAKLTYGQVGGGPGSFIGPVHRAAIGMDGLAKIVAGVFSNIPEEIQQTASELGIDPGRVYDDFQQMAREEGKRSDGIDFVVITVPNHIHYHVAKAFLEEGIHVVCEKPLAFTTEQSLELMNLSRQKNLLFMVTYTYTGYPMVRQAREMVRQGLLGDIRVVMAEYPQDWLADRVELGDNMQAKWRTDPKFAGISCCVGDIGTHVENLVHFVTGLEIERICARLDTFVEGRPLDDNATIMVDFLGGAKGSYWSSQVAVGNENALKLRVYGTKAGLEWEQENPNRLVFKPKGQPVQILSRGNGYLGESAGEFTRLPSGHPEGYFEAFANLYREYCTALVEFLETSERPGALFPSAEDGARGIQFVHDCVQSSEAGAVWVDAAFRK